MFISISKTLEIYFSHNLIRKEFEKNTLLKIKKVHSMYYQVKFVEI